MLTNLQEQINEWSEEQPLIVVYYKGEAFYSKLMTRIKDWEYPLNKDISDTFSQYKKNLAGE